MAVSLGIDIGTNSVGTAWVDTDAREIRLGVTVFPAGVEVSEQKRGAPKNQKRRQTRSQRRSIARRAERRRRLRRLLVERGLLPECALLPADAEERVIWEREAFQAADPWTLRKEGLERVLTPHEFGRVLLHLSQRRGAFGIEMDEDDAEEGKVKEAIERLDDRLQGRTVGQFMWELQRERQRPVPGKPDKHFHDAIRNRRDSYEFHATRDHIRDEFERLWIAQKGQNSALGALLTDDLKAKLLDPAGDGTWRVKGELFGQRRTYWDTGTLGRCTLEPSDHPCPKCDMYAQEFLVLETVNRLRIEWRGEDSRPLSDEERAKVIEVLERQKTASPGTIRRALGLDKKDTKEFVSLNVEREQKPSLNTNWFAREIVNGVFGVERWNALDERTRESVNRALQKIEDADRLRQGARDWWGLTEEEADAIAEAWKSRSNPKNRVNLSRRAIQNLLPYMRRGMSVTEARVAFAKDQENGATDAQRTRYALGTNPASKRDRHYTRKHANLLPPAPTLANPVVRRAIHEVRRHVNEYLREFGRKPDRIVVELARSAKQPAHLRDKQLADNRRREAQRKRLIEEFGLQSLPQSQQIRAVERIRLCIEQQFQCAYSGRSITPRIAAQGYNDQGERVEVDHIVPRSRSWDNGFNNKVLCFVDANRDKGNRTPKEWLSKEAFEKLEQRLEHLKGKTSTKIGDYTIQPNPRKWQILHMDAPSIEEFATSQLTDTAYAARQVAAYLQSALYSNDGDGSRRILTTKGNYTAILRRDWGLLESELDRQWGHPTDAPDEPTHGERGVARRGEKERIDHRHHAIDAVAIALTDGARIQDLARFAAAQQEARVKSGGQMPKRERLPSPWGSVEEFRRQVVDTLNELVVSHRPVKRRIVGQLHREQIYGIADRKKNRFTIRKPVEELTAEMLREEYRDQKGQLVDPPLRKGGLVRDRNLRRILRECIKREKLDPDKVTKTQIKELAKAGKFKMPSGVPIYAVTLVRTINHPVIIEPDDAPIRVYESSSNHHMEIVENIHTGAWKGEVVNMYNAAKRVRPKKGEPFQPLVQRDHGPNHRFVMSVAEGETLRMRHPDSNEPGYFVVFKLDKDGIHLVPHWDARPSKSDRPNGVRAATCVTPGRLKALGIADDAPPYKVAVSPLGDIRPLLND